jgi:basic membrane lipoprotein Med (substrate-binding protein (PBP1-ABC) superfamily)
MSTNTPWNISRRRLLAGTATLAAGVAGAPFILRSPAYAAPAPLGTPIDPKDLIIAFGHVGPISDEGWTWSHHRGREAIAKAYPQAKILEVENIPFSSQASRIFTQFVQEGANLVFITSGYGDFLYDVAKKNPDVAFMECGRQPKQPNVVGFYIQHWQPSYLLGMASAMLSKSNKLGYIASFPVAAVLANVNSFQLGARSVNPQIQTQVVSINSWFDPQAATQAANALIDAGCDVLYGIMDEPAYLQVAEKRGKWAVLWNTDIRRFGPNAYVSSLMLDWDAFYLAQVKARLEGAWKGDRTAELLPLGKGTDRDSWGQNVPKDVAAKVDEVRERMLKGYSPFVGPIADAKGEVRIPAGTEMDTNTLYVNWRWPMQGITGLNV